MKELLSKDILKKDLIEVAGALEKVRYYVVDVPSEWEDLEIGNRWMVFK